MPMLKPPLRRDTTGYTYRFSAQTREWLENARRVASVVTGGNEDNF